MQKYGVLSRFDQFNTRFNTVGAAYAVLPQSVSVHECRAIPCMWRRRQRLLHGRTISSFRKTALIAQFSQPAG